MSADPDTQFDIVRDATRGGGSVAWVGWIFGPVILGLGLVPPQHWVLAAIGATLVGTLTVRFVLELRRRWRHHHAAHDT